MNKSMMWVFVVVAFVVGAFAGYYYEKSKLTNQMMMAESSMQKQVDDLKMKNDQIMQHAPQPSSAMMHTGTQPSGAMIGK